MNHQPPKSPRTSLKDWEDWLAPQVRQVELLGEVPITADECAQLGRVIGLYVKGLGHSQALRILADNYPCALAIYLVAQGIYGYRGGDYWSEVIEVTHLNRTYAWQVGQTFEAILEKMRLPLFYDMRAEGAHRYVSLILAHGGIPDYCLPDFFRNMLQPSVLRMQYADMSAAEIIDEWFWRSSVQYLTDKPVIRFLVYGDRVAEDFVERCREMAREYLDSGLVPDGERVGLPDRVVEAYRQWIAEQGAEQVERETGDRWRLRKPDVLIDPWGEGVFLALPPQQVPATEIRADIAWQVKVGDETCLLPVRVRRTGFDWKTTEESLLLRRPAETYEVSLLANGQVKNTWRYQGVDDKHPLLVFDAIRCTLQKLSYSLPARRLGLLYPAQLDLHIEGEAHLEEEWPRLPWDWAGFRGQTWDLGSATLFKLLEDGREILTVTFRPDEAGQQPSLEGGTLLSPEKPGVRPPVYEGPPPSVRIPLTGRRNLGEELVRWRVTVQNKWAASPNLKLTGTLDDLRSRLVIGEGYVDLLLRHPLLLGEQPFGNYLVRLRGPLGRGAEFTLRIVPHLTIMGHKELYLPDAQNGPMPATLLIETPPGYHLECEGTGGECHAEAINQQKDRWEYQAEVDPDVTEVELTLVRRLPSGDMVRVPVTVPIRRLRWALVSDQAVVEQHNWTGHIVKVPVDALLQSESPCLLVDLPTGGMHPLRLGLRLVDMDGAVLQVTDPVPLPAGQRLLRFELAAFLDTIRASRSPVLRVELEVLGLSGQKDVLCWPVLSLTQSLLVKDVKLKVMRLGKRPVFELQWHEPMPLRNRHVRFWPLWRPWDPVLEQAIPDTAEGRCEFEAPLEQLRSGKYRLEFLVVDPWTPQIALKPPKGAPGTVEVELISAEAQLRDLEARLQARGGCFDLFLERAVLHHDMGTPGKAKIDWQWCFEHLDDGSISQVLSLVELAQALGDAAALKALQIKMFAAGRVERLIRLHEQGKVSSEHFQGYLANLPRPGLLSEKTCEYLLEIGDEAIRLQAAEALIGRSNPRGLEVVLQWVEKARLSDSDAVSFLKRNTSLSVAYLEKQSGNPTALRLLKTLSQDLGDNSPIIQAGTWVFCDAGWGRIERIEDQAGRPVEQFIRGQTDYRLYVTLRPGFDAVRIVIDLPTNKLSFPTATCLYTCTKCNSFTTQDSYEIIHRHNVVAHSGTNPHTPRGAAFRIERATTRALGTLEYRAREPRDQLDLPRRSDVASGVR